MPPMLSTGDEFGRYRIERYLGAGGTGEVYAATDTKVERIVALKFLLAALPESERQNARLRSEARHIARMNHPHIAQLHTTGEHEGRLFLDMEFIRGQSLAQRLHDQPIVPIGDAIQIARDIADALDHAHHGRTIHRDLKPSNVVFGDDDRLRVLDFGIAVHGGGDDDADRDLQLYPGTPPYMAPEQWTDPSPTGAVDVWALGIVMWQMLEGFQPFVGDDREIRAEVTSTRPCPPLCRHAPRALLDLVLACLHKDPEQRPTMLRVLLTLCDLEISESRWYASMPSPFGGLLPFHERKAHQYNGREPDLDACIERLTDAAVLPVVGPSACGKSSFVRAGVIPALRDREPWVVLDCPLDDDPWLALAGALLTWSPPRSGDDGMDEHATPRPRSAHEVPLPRREQELAEALRAHPGQLRVELGRIAVEAEASVLLFVDQLERVFWRLSPQEDRQYVAMLTNAAESADGGVRVIFTLRDDYAWLLVSEGESPRDAFNRAMNLRSLEPDRMLRILTAAIGLTDCEFEDRPLENEIVRSVATLPGSLPLLQICLNALWQARDPASNTITWASYDDVGGVPGATAAYADRVYEGLSEADRARLRQVLAALGTPRRASRGLASGELRDHLTDDATEVLELLIGARLVTVGRDAGEAEARYFLIHPDLATTWNRLAGWIGQTAR